MYINIYYVMQAVIYNIYIINNTYIINIYYVAQAAGVPLVRCVAVSTPYVYNKYIYSK